MAALDDVTAARDSLASLIALETAKQAASPGKPKPSYSINGKSVSWSEWLSARLADLEKLNGLIVTLQGPVAVSSRMVP